MIIKCKRCNIETEYINNQYAKKIKNRENCIACRSIDDQYLENFKNGKYCKPCPKCNAEMIYKNKRDFLAAIRLNPQCHACASKQNWDNNEYRNVQLERLRHMTDSTKQKLSVIMKEKFQNEATKEHFFNSVKKARKEFDENLKNPEFKKNWITNIKKSHTKYKGTNHWTQNPAVMEKIINSCKKYKGDNHWFRTEKGHYKIVNGKKVYKNDTSK